MTWLRQHPSSRRRQSKQSPPLVSRALAIRLISVAAASVSFFLPLSLLPSVAAKDGGPGSASAVSTALLISTVMVELVTPRLLRHISDRAGLGLGLVLLGTPSFVLHEANLPVMLSANVVRGAGFALTVVAGGALTVGLLPRERLGEGVAVLGVVSSAAAMLALPGGVWVADHLGTLPVLTAAGVAPVLALPTVLLLPRQKRVGAGTGRAVSMYPAGIWILSAAFATSAAGAGVLVTFMPSLTAPSVAAQALLVFSASSTAARWVAGRLGDRLGHQRLMPAAVGLGSLAMAVLALHASPSAATVGALCLGLAFGSLQNITLTSMYASASQSRYDSVTALWNAAYDGGMALGALAMGFTAPRIGFQHAFLFAAALCAWPLALRHKPNRSNRSRARMDPASSLQTRNLNNCER